MDEIKKFYMTTTKQMFFRLCLSFALRIAQDDPKEAWTVLLLEKLYIEQNDKSQTKEEQTK